MLDKFMSQRGHDFIDFPIGFGWTQAIRKQVKLASEASVSHLSKAFFQFGIKRLDISFRGRPIALALMLDKALQLAITGGIGNIQQAHDLTGWQWRTAFLIHQ